MPVKNDREYRNLGSFKLNEENNDIVEGYATTFDTYMLWEDPDMRFFERIDRNAFDDADMSDVVFLRDHCGRVLARTKNGSVQLNIDDHGMRTRTNLGLTDAAKEMKEDIEVGNYSQMSFSFTVERDRIEWLDEHSAVRIIESIGKVYDVSAVAFPANPYTDIGLSARSLFDGVIEEKEAERLKAEQKARAKKVLQLRIRMGGYLSDGNQRDEDGRHSEENGGNQ